MTGAGSAPVGQRVWEEAVGSGPASMRVWEEAAGSGPAGQRVQEEGVLVGSSRAQDRSIEIGPIGVTGLRDYSRTRSPYLPTL
jgi:hypothetical protein